MFSPIFPTWLVNCISHCNVLDITYYRLRVLIFRMVSQVPYFSCVFPKWWAFQWTIQILSIVQESTFLKDTLILAPKSSKPQSIASSIKLTTLYSCSNSTKKCSVRPGLLKKKRYAVSVSVLWFWLPIYDDIMTRKGIPQSEQSMSILSLQSFSLVWPILKYFVFDCDNLVALWLMFDHVLGIPSCSSMLSLQHYML